MQLSQRMRKLVQPHLVDVEPYDPMFSPTRINLSANENTYDLPAPVREHINEALSGLPGFVCYSVLPLWGMTGDSSWPVLVMGLVLYLFRKRRGVQVAAFTVYYLLYGVVYMSLMASNIPGFVWTQLFTVYYEIYGVLAAPLMMLFHGQRGRGH